MYGGSFEMPKCTACGEVRPGELSKNFIVLSVKLKKFGVANSVKES